MYFSLEIISKKIVFFFILLLTAFVQKGTGSREIKNVVYVIKRYAGLPRELSVLKKSLCFFIVSTSGHNNLLKIIKLIKTQMFLWLTGLSNLHQML